MPREQSRPWRARRNHTKKSAAHAELSGQGTCCKNKNHLKTVGCVAKKTGRRGCFVCFIKDKSNRRMRRLREAFAR